MVFIPWNQFGRRKLIYLINVTLRVFQFDNILSSFSYFFLFAESWTFPSSLSKHLAFECMLNTAGVSRIVVQPKCVVHKLTKSISAPKIFPFFVLFFDHQWDTVEQMIQQKQEELLPFLVSRMATYMLTQETACHVLHVHLGNKWYCVCNMSASACFHLYSIFI